MIIKQQIIIIRYGNSHCSGDLKKCSNSNSNPAKISNIIETRLEQCDWEFRVGRDLQPAHQLCRAKCLHSVWRAWMSTREKVNALLWAGSLDLFEPFPAKWSWVIFTCLGGTSLGSIENVMSSGCMHIHRESSEIQSGARQTAPPPPVSWQQRPLYSGDEYERLSAPLSFSRLLAEEWKFFDFCLKLVSFISFPFSSFPPVFDFQTHSSQTYAQRKVWTHSFAYALCARTLKHTMDKGDSGWFKCKNFIL